MDKVNEYDDPYDQMVSKAGDGWIRCTLDDKYWIILLISPLKPILWV